jgi:VWFA-related protein
MRSNGPKRVSAIGVFVATGFLQLAASALSSFAQCPGTESPGPSASSGQATEGQQIALNVEVTDKSGRPLGGLEAADFKVFDNNQPQKVLAFGAIDTAHPPTAPVQVQIIIDAVNSDINVVAEERDGVSAFLKNDSAKQDYPTSISILENSGLKPIAGPTQDGTELLTALNGTEARLRVINRSGGVWGAGERTAQAIGLIKEMVSPQSRTPGRKLVLFLSPGWPMLSEAGANIDTEHRSQIFDDIIHISNGLRESCTSLYSLDPSSFGTGNSFAYDSFLKGVSKFVDAQYPDLSLQVLSEHSGGQVIVGGNDIKAEIKAALRGATTYYNLTFEAAPGARVTEYHAIRVTVDKPRLNVHTTAGYYVKGSQ